jgi:hypothetical protein
MASRACMGSENGRDELPPRMRNGEWFNVFSVCNRPSPGGEPLWNVSRRPRNIPLNAGPAEMRENKRLPGTFHRDLCTDGLRSVYIRPIELHRAGPLLYANQLPVRTEALGINNTLGNSREPPV